jgi:hypothetical protein
MDRDIISGALTEMEDRRTSVWNAIVERVTRVEFLEDGSEERIAESLESLDSLIKLIAEETKQSEAEVRSHLNSLEEFRDIEIHKIVLNLSNQKISSNHRIALNISHFLRISKNAWLRWV